MVWLVEFNEIWMANKKWTLLDEWSWSTLRLDLIRFDFHRWVEDDHVDLLSRLWSGRWNLIDLVFRNFQPMEMVKCRNSTLASIYSSVWWHWPRLRNCLLSTVDWSHLLTLLLPAVKFNIQMSSKAINDSPKRSRF